MHTTEIEHHTIQSHQNSTAMPQNTSVNTIDDLKYFLYVNASISCIIAFFAIFGNFFIILIFFKIRSIRNINNIVVTFLSMGDFLRGVVVMTIKIYDQYSLQTSLPSTLCNITAVVCGFTFVFSPLILALIAFIRYGKIVGHKKRYLKVTNTKVYIATMVAFVLSISFAFLPIYGTGVYKYSIPHGVCFAPWSVENRLFRTIFYCLVVGTAFPILSISYLKLYLALRSHRKKLMKNREDSSSSAQLHNIEKKCHCIQKKKLKKDKKREYSGTDASAERGQVVMDNYNKYKNNPNIAVIVAEEECTKTMSTTNLCKCPKTKSRYDRLITSYEYQVTIAVIMIFIAYCVCWLPAAVINVIALVDTKLISMKWKIVIVTMVDLKSSLDPIIYGFGNRQYRKAFLYLIHPKKKRYIF